MSQCLVFYFVGRFAKYSSHQRPDTLSTFNCIILEPSDQIDPTIRDIFILGVMIQRCKAKSKRTGNQCLKAAMRGKAVCRTHGGASTGPRTPRGRQKCAEVKTVHGRETFDDMAKQHEDWIVSSFDVLTGREMDALYKLLGKVKEHHHAKTLEIL